MMPNSTLKGRANLFVLPDLDAANIAYNLVRVMTDGVAIGPILMGIDQPAHILTPASTPRRVVNMASAALYVNWSVAILLSSGCAVALAWS